MHLTFYKEITMSVTVSLSPDKRLAIVTPDSSSILSSDATEAVSKEVFKVMATTYSLMFVIQGCHWNIMGPHFVDLHKMFGVLYQNLFKAIDHLAERLRALGTEAPYTPERFAFDSAIQIKTPLRSEHEMLETSIQGYLTLTQTTHRAIQTCHKYEDYSSAHLLTQLLAEQEDASWQLISLSRD